jgi:hypothetical protein
MRISRIILVVILIVVLTGSTVMAAGAVLSAQLSDIKLYLNNNKINKDIIVVDGSSYLPLRAISDALGLKIDWNSDERAIYLTQQSSGSSDAAVLNDLGVVDKITKENQDLKSQVASLQQQIADLKAGFATGQSNGTSTSTGEVQKSIDVSGEWKLDNGAILNLKQDGRFISGFLIASWDKSQWPTPVEGTIDNNKLTLKFNFDNRDIFKHMLNLPDDNLFLDTTLYKKPYGLFELEVDSKNANLKGTFQLPKIWYHIDLFPFLDKIANGGEPENTEKKWDETFVRK